MVPRISKTCISRMRRYVDSGKHEDLNDTTWTYVAHYLNSGDAHPRLNIALMDFGLKMLMLDSARAQKKTAQQFTKEWLAKYGDSR